MGFVARGNGERPAFDFGEAFCLEMATKGAFYAVAGEQRGASVGMVLGHPPGSGTGALCPHRAILTQLSGCSITPLGRALPGCYDPGLSTDLEVPRGLRH